MVETTRSHSNRERRAVQDCFIHHASSVSLDRFLAKDERSNWRCTFEESDLEIPLSFQASYIRCPANYLVVILGDIMTSH